MAKIMNQSYQYEGGITEARKIDQKNKVNGESCDEDC